MIQTSILRLHLAILLISVFGVPQLAALAQKNSDTRMAKVEEARAAGQTSSATKGDATPDLDGSRAPDSQPPRSGAKTKAKMREIHNRQLKNACIVWLTQQRDSKSDDAIKPDDSNSYCNCFARNFLALAENKDDPAREVQFFVEYYTIRDKKPQLEDELGDYFYATDEVEPGCLKDTEFQMEIH